MRGSYMEDILEKLRKKLGGELFVSNIYMMSMSWHFLLCDKFGVVTDYYRYKGGRFYKRDKSEFDMTMYPQDVPKKYQPYTQLLKDELGCSDKDLKCPDKEISLGTYYAFVRRNMKEGYSSSTKNIADVYHYTPKYMSDCIFKGLDVFDYIKKYPTRDDIKGDVYAQLSQSYIAFFECMKYFSEELSKDDNMFLDKEWAGRYIRNVAHGVVEAMCNFYKFAR